MLCAGCGEQTKQNQKKADFEKDTSMQVVSNQERATSIAEEGSDFIDPEKFKVSRQDSFSLEDWYYGARQDSLVILTKQEIEKYFQDSVLKNDLDKDRGFYYYFSVQENQKAKVVITIIEEYDYCCADLYLMTYDQNNKLIGKSKVASSVGDGGSGYEKYGKFISDSIYRLIRLEETTLRDDQDTMEYKIDSVVTRFSVDKNLNFIKLDEEKFQWNKIIVN